ncbi:MAG: electron transfer flavoprotein subunit beta/FixA family protein [Euryarchaeota archaeon]|nr:electron transfer flavoprotein subunit beta/FixA family protein [Euryarchaeota archaeon]
MFVKEVPDVAQLRIDPGSREPKLEGLPTKVNDFDKNAVEEAVRLKEKASGSTITVFSVKGKKLKETVKEPLAMGADSAVVVPFDGALDGRGTATILAKAVEKHGPFDVVFAGEVSLDVNAGEVTARAAALLGMEFVWNAKEVKAVDDGSITLVRDADEDEEVKVPFPVLVTMNDEMNNPRLPALMQILAAGKKPITEESLDSLGLSVDDLKPVATLLSNKAPKTERKHVIFSGEDREEKLVEALKQEGII